MWLNQSDVDSWMAAIALSLIPVLLLIVLFWLVIGLPYNAALLAAAAAYLPFVPLAVRMSRVLWIHIDQTLDPGRD